MKVPDFGEWLMGLVSSLFPKSKTWRAVVFTVGFALALFLAYAKFTTRWNT